MFVDLILDNLLVFSAEGVTSGPEEEPFLGLTSGLGSAWESDVLVVVMPLTVPLLPLAVAVAPSVAMLVVLALLPPVPEPWTVGVGMEVRLVGGLLHISSNMTLDWSVVVMPLVLELARFLEAVTQQLLDPEAEAEDGRAPLDPDDREENCQSTTSDMCILERNKSTGHCNYTVNTVVIFKVLFQVFKC